MRPIWVNSLTKLELVHPQEWMHQFSEAYLQMIPHGANVGFTPGRHGRQRRRPIRGQRQENLQEGSRCHACPMVMYMWRRLRWERIKTRRSKRSAKRNPIQGHHWSLPIRLHQSRHPGRHDLKSGSGQTGCGGRLMVAISV